ncbi:mechanosensitive ion channel domain-containing protein [Zwartia panacis]|uniref:mechanosensitive ion channel domain-containing protein n=1 Tax=Zwartia panacis TaxID=2683345 RepID=UPI0025B42D50|nr:mechanosensitive ion channel domain-containing protein [Zwartia panacis]MDN4016534.1 mechanosensitive ion channel [Zwartia panacis]
MTRFSFLIFSQKALQSLCLMMTCLFLPNLVSGQISLPGIQPKQPSIQSETGIPEQRAKVESQLAETQRQRDAKLPNNHDLPNADAVSQADKQRLLDRLAFLQAERIKKLDELAALQKAPPPLLSSLPQVQALGDFPPYSAIAVDALRDELDGQLDKLQGLLSGLQIREVEKQTQLEQKRRADEALRLSQDRFANARGEEPKAQAKLAQEQAELRQRVAESELAVLSIDEDLLKLKASQMRVLSDELTRVVKKALAAQQLTETDLNAQRTRMTALRKRLSQETAKANERRRNHERERTKLLASSPLPDSKEGQRLSVLDQALITDGIILDGLNALETLTQIVYDAWEKRYLILSGGNLEQRRQAQASLDKIYQGLINRKRLSQEQRNSAQAAIREQETRVANIAPDTAEHNQAKELLALFNERAAMYDRLELAANRFERQLARWSDDTAQATNASLSLKANQVGERIFSTIQSFWQFELFSVDDVSEIDGRKVTVSYGVTLGKSIVAILLFVLGYWLFSKVLQGLQIFLVRRFGISDQLASVIRRWVMILLAIGLIVFVLNLARIPLTVFAFMGGALAIGVGFGTQTIIKNFISGIIILFERKVRVGDIIELGGTIGHVTAVDMRATTIRGFDGVEALVPNSSFLETQVTNWTYSNQQIRRELRIGIAYGADTRVTEQLLLTAAANHPSTLKTPAPEVFFEDFADNALIMVLVYWVELGPKLAARSVDSDLRHAIYQQLTEAGIAIPYPQRDVHLNVTAPLPVSVSRQAKEI